MTRQGTGFGPGPAVQGEGGARNVSDLAQGEIEAELLATNAALHAHVALSLLNRGIHLFVEKPLAASSEDARAMVKAAA